MNIAWCHNDRAFDVVSEFVSTRIWGKSRTFAGNTAMAVIDNSGVLVGGVVFSNYDSDAAVMEVSGASDNKRWMSRSMLHQIYNYAFNQMKCQAVVQRSDPANKSLARMLTAYGFDRYDIPHMRGKNKPEALFILCDDVWRANGFHKENANGRQSTRGH